MNISLSILYIELIWCHFNVEAHSDKYPALIFDGKLNKLLELSESFTTSTSYRYNDCHLACPAENEEERKFNEMYSLHDEALFVLEDSSSREGCDVDIKVCAKSYKLSVAFSVESGKWEFGYEIYYKNEEFKKFIPVSYEKYKSLKNTRFSEVSSPKRIFSRTEQYEKIELKMKDKRMEFIWIPIFKVERYRHQFQNVEYEITHNNISPVLPCQDYSLGEEVFDNTELDLLYSEEAQKNSFEGVVPPDYLWIGSCKLKYMCFEKWLLIPPDQFQFIYSSSVICSDMATIPIWSGTIKNVLQKVDEFLYTLYWVIREPLHIIAGVHGILTLPTMESSFNKTNNIFKTILRSFLRNDNKPIILKKNNIAIQVPEIIYKLVTIKLKKTGETYGVLIIIHNDPSIMKPICKNKSLILGWQEIRYETLCSETCRRITSKFIYVCAISKNILKKLGLPYKKYAQTKKLSLKEFPFFNDKNKLQLRNLNADISNELERISKNPNTRPKKERDNINFYHRPIFF